MTLMDVRGEVSDVLTQGGVLCLVAFRTVGVTGFLNPLRLIGIGFGGLLEVLNRLAEPGAYFRQFPGAEDNEHDQKYND